MIQIDFQIQGNAISFELRHKFLEDGEVRLPSKVTFTFDQDEIKDNGVPIIKRFSRFIVGSLIDDAEEEDAVAFLLRAKMLVVAVLISGEVYVTSSEEVEPDSLADLSEEERQKRRLP